MTEKINQEDSSNFWQPNIRLVWNKNWFENNYWKWHTTNNLKMNPEKKLVHKITTFSGFLKLPRGGGPRSWTNEGKKNPSLRDFRSNFWLSKRSASKINCHWTFFENWDANKVSCLLKYARSSKKIKNWVKGNSRKKSQMYNSLIEFERNSSTFPFLTLSSWAAKLIEFLALNLINTWKENSTHFLWLR